MAVDDIVGVRIIGRFQMQNVVNVIHYRIEEQAESERNILQTMAELWEATYKTSWLGLHVDTYRIMGIRAFNLTGVNKPPGIAHIDEAGSVALDEAPSPMCRTITLYTNSSNYRRRGRLMLSGATVSDFNTADGAVNDTLQGNLTTFGETIVDGMSAVGDTFEAGLAPTDVLPFEAYTSALGRKTPSVIRSRRVRGFLIG